MRVGVLGGGQLGQMLAHAGTRLGIAVRCFDEHEGAVAGKAGELHVDSFTSPTRLETFLEDVDVVTYEFENVPADLADTIAACGVHVRPSPAVLRICQDRFAEKACFADLKIASAPWCACTSLADVRAGIVRIGGIAPVVIKARRGGYDGKGQWVVRDGGIPSDLTEEIARRGVIVEAFVPFVREVSQVSARAVSGEIRHYPLTENVHRRGILHTSVAPATHHESTAKHARAAVEKFMRSTDYVGVLAIEFFETATESGPALVANEMAPRVHNSGHWTMDASHTSQFENHLRAVSGMALGDTAMKPGVHAAGMLNLVGTIPHIEPSPSVFIHDYGKSPRPGRKLGHVNITGASDEERDARLARTASLIR